MVAHQLPAVLQRVVPQPVARLRPVLQLAELRSPGEQQRRVALHPAVHQQREEPVQSVALRRVEPRPVVRMQQAELRPAALRRVARQPAALQRVVPLPVEHTQGE